MREAFLDMLIKANNRFERLQQIAARKAKKIGTAEEKTLTALEEMLGTDLGDRFFKEMAKNPAAKKAVLATLVAAGGGYMLKKMYESCSQGTFKDDFSNAAIAIIEFVPGGIGIKQTFVNDGIDAQTALLFVKDAIYLTPAWPIVLTGDILMIAIDLGGVVNAYRTAKPNVTLPAGTYTIIDSDPETWAQNAGSNGRGHAFVRGYPATGTAASTTPSPPKPPPASGGTMVTAIFENRSSENVHIFVDGETFGPENRITPGGRSEVAVRMPPDGRIKFIAGRNGQVIATKIWNGDPSDTKRYPRVVFDGKNLLVTTGLR